MKTLASLVVIGAIAVLFFPVSVVYALNGTIEFTYEPVDIHIDVIDPGNSTLPIIYDVSKVVFTGFEYRNTVDEDGSGTLSAGDWAMVDGAIVVLGMQNSQGQMIYGTGLNVDWEMTATYQALRDNIFLVDATGINYLSAPGVGVLTLYVDTDMTQRALGDGTGYDNGTMVAQFAAYNGGGVFKVIAPFDGSRDVFMLNQGSYPGFFVPYVNTLNYDSNLDADSDSNGVGGDFPIPSAWPYPTAGNNFPWAYFVEVDGSLRFGNVPEENGGECRFTGGGVDTNKNIIIGSPASSENDRYHYGGQVGAPTGAQPQPWGEWTHRQQFGDEGKFTFHGGTASAPPGTEIDAIYCMDPNWCRNARPAPFKQISWDGVGTFKNISDEGIAALLNTCVNPTGKVHKKANNNNCTPEPVCPDVTEISTGAGGTDATLHWFRVHWNDAGEPGSGETSKGKGKKSTRDFCDLDVSGPIDWPYTDYLISEDQCTDCPDTYQIEIYCKGTDPAVDPTNMVIYSVGAFVDGGNGQIHPPVGEHMNP